MKRIKLIAGIVVIFLLGGLAGASVTRYYGRSLFGDHHRPRPSHAQKIEFIMARLKRDLDLTKAQMREIRPIVVEGEKKINSLRATIRPEIRKILDQGFVNMRVKLGPEQQKKLDELMAKLKRFAKKKEKN